MMISYPLVHVAFAESQEERDNVASTVICLLIPVLLFWMQLAPAVYGRGQALPEMAVSSPNEAFNLNTGTYTSNVEQLPKLRRVLADDNPTARQAVHGFPIPFHDTETLFDLVVSGEVDEVRLFLLDNGVELLNCHARDTGETALHVAITHPDLPADKRGRMIELLVNMKAPLDLCDRDGRTPVHAAAWLKDVQLLCTMLQSAVKSCRFRQSQAHMSQMLNVVAADGSTALHIATKLQDMGSLTALLSLGADPGKSAPPPAGKPGVKPHDWEAACRAAAGDIAHGKSAFLLACEVGSVAMVNQMLLSAPRSCNLEQVSPLGMTPLMTACLFGHDDLARFLMKHGASVWHVSPKAYPNRRMTAVHCCAMGAGASVCCALVCPPVFFSIFLCYQLIVNSKENADSMSEEISRTTIIFTHKQAKHPRHVQTNIAPILFGTNNLAGCPSMYCGNPKRRRQGSVFFWWLIRIPNREK
ncbi:hypothetical protein DIPPA_01126 [Diplonema papillatum]|nr:hypothetical protein DIPPA_01126 [Diplonema papillatum]